MKLYFLFLLVASIAALPGVGLKSSTRQNQAPKKSKMTHGECLNTYNKKMRPINLKYAGACKDVDCHSKYNKLVALHKKELEKCCKSVPPPGPKIVIPGREGYHHPDDL